MSYKILKRKSDKKVDLRKLDDYDLYFEEVPPAAAYKIQRALNKSIRKLKLA